MDTKWTNIAKAESNGKFIFHCRSPSVYMSLSSNIAKVESRDKIYFGYAETKAFICGQGIGFVLEIFNLPVKEPVVSRKAQEGKPRLCHPHDLSGRFSNVLSRMPYRMSFQSFFIVFRSSVVAIIFVSLSGIRAGSFLRQTPPSRSALCS